MRLNGKTITMIARELTNEGVLPPSVYNNKNITRTYTTNIWKVSTVNHILCNEIYIGTLIQRKFDKINYKLKKRIKLPKEQWIKVENVCSPIIDKELFDRVNALKQIYGNLTTRKHDYLLKGLVDCKECGGKLIVRKSYGKKVDKAYYCCKNNVSYRNSTCSLHYFQEEKLNQIVVSYLKEIFSLYNTYEELKDRCNNKKVRAERIINLKKELENYKKKLCSIKKAISDLYIDRANEILSEEEFHRIKSEFEQTKKIHTEKIENLETIILKKEGDAINKNGTEELVKKYLNVEKPTKLLMRELIQKIEIDKEKNIKIYWNFHI